MRIGIDLGTTYSLVARLDGSGVPLLLPDRSFKDTILTPSVVHLSGLGAYVGQAAETLVAHDPTLPVLRFFKRHLASGKPLAYQQGTPWYSEAISALVLKKLRIDAEIHAAQDVEGAVITVPAHFDHRQRRSVEAAALMADLPLMGIVEEPVAAALYYGTTGPRDEQTLLVYDLGGGTFDATVLHVTASGVQVLSKDGTTDLGGKEVDERVADIILDQCRKAGIDPRLDQVSLLQLRRISEGLKIDLCKPGTTGVRQTVLLGSDAVEVSIRRKVFESRIQDLLDRTETILDRCLAGAGLEKQDVDVVLLVGGSSEIPTIRERLALRFNAPHQRILFHEPTKAVAKGAAMHAAQLSGDADRYRIPPEFRGVTGHHLAIRAIDDRTGRVQLDLLIRKNMPLPARATKIYYTAPGQRRLVIELVQFIEEGSEINMGSLVVGPLPDRPGSYPVEVTIAYRNDGTVEVEARDPDSGESLRRTFGDDTAEGLRHLATQQQLVRATDLNAL
jgi:molecular chaperone DnaK